MYLRYVEQAKTSPTRRLGLKHLQLSLTVLLVILGAVAAYEIFAFAQEYLRALGT